MFVQILSRSILIDFSDSYEKAVQKMKRLEKSETSSSQACHSEEEMNLKRRSRPNSFYRDFQTNIAKEYSQQSPVNKKINISTSSSNSDDIPTLSPPTGKKK